MIMDRLPLRIFTIHFYMHFVLCQGMTSNIQDQTEVTSPDYDNTKHHSAFNKNQQLLAGKRWGDQEWSTTQKQRHRSIRAETQCGGEEISFGKKHFSCQYDNACYEKFHDCCPDYVKQCGNQTTISPNRMKLLEPFTCVRMGLDDKRGCKVSGPVGVWMITRCPSSWPSNDTKARCHNPAEKFSFPLADYLPVVAENQFTYRNEHCAICNGVQNYTAWNIRMWTPVIPPAEYDLETKLQFIIDNGGIFINLHLKDWQRKRYCVGALYKDECNNVSHAAFNDCLNGPVEVVVKFRYPQMYYKNKACAVCNGVSRFTGWHVGGVCGYSEGFSIVFNTRKIISRTTSKVVRAVCFQGVYDKYLMICRKGYVTSKAQSLSDEFLVIFWLDMFSIHYNTSTIKQPFIRALVESFNLTSSQISEVKFHKQPSGRRFLVATFRFTLTPYQVLTRACNNRNLTSIVCSNKSREFLRLLNFTGNFTLHFNNHTIPVIKTVSKQLACFEGKELKPYEYQLERKSGKVLENKTGKYYSLKEHLILEKQGGNITLCRKLVVSGCAEGAHVPLRQDEYVIFSNFSLYHNATNRTFEFGEYQINEAEHAGESQFLSSYSNFLRNTTISVCLPYQTSYNRSEPQDDFKSNHSLRVLTHLGFSLSIICLLLLLLKYTLFRELRTLPGKNLMNLSFSLLFSHLVWLIGTANFQTSPLCEVFAVLEHYLLLASFLAMTVISYHSSLVFSNPLAAVKQNRTQRTFMKYSALIWSCPAIFVAICVALDKTGVFDVNYGTRCWIGTNNALLFLFLLPGGVLLLINISTFSRTAISLSRQNELSVILQRKARENLVICAKLATLLGFPWIIAFFGVLFPDVAALEYLFVIFVCFQGFYIAVAFLFTKNTFQLWRKWRDGKGADSTKQRPVALAVFHVHFQAVSDGHSSGQTTNTTKQSEESPN